MRRELPLGIVNQILTKLARDVARKLKIVVTHWNETSEDSPWSIRVESGCNIATIMKCQSIVERQRNGQNVRPVDVKFIRRIVAHAVNGSETSVWKMRKSMLDNQEWANEDYSVIFFRLVRVSAYADAIVLGSTPFCKVKLLVEHAKQLGYVIANKSEPFVDQITEGPASILPPSVFDGAERADGPETCFGGNRKKRVVFLTEDAKIERIAKLEKTISGNKKKCYPVYVTRDGNKSGESRYCLAMSMMTTKQRVPMEVRGVQLREERVGSGGGVVLYRPLETTRSLMYEVSSKRHVFLEKVGKWNEARDSLLKYMDADSAIVAGFKKISGIISPCYLTNDDVSKMNLDQLNAESDKLEEIRVSYEALSASAESHKNSLQTKFRLLEDTLENVLGAYEKYAAEAGKKDARSVLQKAIETFGSADAETTYVNARKLYVEHVMRYLNGAAKACHAIEILVTAKINHTSIEANLVKLETNKSEAKLRVTNAEGAAEAAGRRMHSEKKEGIAESNADLNLNDKREFLKKMKVELDKVNDIIDNEEANQTAAKREVENAQNARGPPGAKPDEPGDDDAYDVYKKSTGDLKKYITTTLIAEIDKHIAEAHLPSGIKNREPSLKEEMSHVLGEEFRIEVTQRDPVFFAVQVSGELFRLVDVDVDVDVITMPDNFRKKNERTAKNVTNANQKVTEEEADYKECVQTAAAYFELRIGYKNIDPSSVNRWNLMPLMPLGPAFGSGFGFTKPDVTRLLIVPYGLSVIGDPKGTNMPLYNMTIFLHRSGIYVKKEDESSIVCAWCGMKAEDKKGLEVERKYAPRAQCNKDHAKIIGGLGSLCNAGTCNHAAVAAAPAATEGHQPAGVWNRIRQKVDQALVPY